MQILRPLGVLGCAVVLAACGESWRAKFPDGTRLYDANKHQYFGRVVGYDEQHDFQNGTNAQAAILIEEADDAHTRVWASCETAQEAFAMERPTGP